MKIKERKRALPKAIKMLKDEKSHRKNNSKGKMQRKLS